MATGHITRMKYTSLCSAPPVYRDEKGRLYERTIEDKTHYRLLPTADLDDAKEIVEARRRRYLMWKEGVPGYGNPYHQGRPTTLPVLVPLFLAAGAPGAKRTARARSTSENIASRVSVLVKWPGWESLGLDSYRIQHVEAYADWRFADGNMTKGAAIDKELSILRQLILWAVRKGYITRDPFVGVTFPRYYEGNPTKCREHQPEGPEQLHAVAQNLFRHPRSIVLGFQYLWEAFTGMRTAETITLLRHAKEGEHGFIDWERGHIRIVRGKKGVNPFIRITPELESLIRAIFVWHDSAFPTSKWLFPSPSCFVYHVNRTALTKALTRVSNEICDGKRLTSHGARAYYVTVRRSHRIPDEQIADELGDLTGAPMIIHTYGDIPPNWRDADVEPVKFIPESGPAWNLINNTNPKEP